MCTGDGVDESLHQRLQRHRDLLLAHLQECLRRGLHPAARSPPEPQFWGLKSAAVSGPVTKHIITCTSVACDVVFSGPILTDSPGTWTGQRGHLLRPAGMLPQAPLG